MPRVAASRRQILVQAGSVFALAIVVRLVHFLAMRDSLLFDVLICDCWQYDQWAQTITSGQWLGSEVFYQTPLYPYLLAVVYSIFGHSIWAVRGVQAVFGALACVCLARAGSRYFSHRAGWIAGILLAVYPPAIFFDGILQKASLDLLLMTALVWVLAAVQDETMVFADGQRSGAAGPTRSAMRWRPLGLLAAGGLLLGLMTLNRENAAVLFPVLLAWIVWLSWPAPGQLGAARVGAFVLGAAAVLLPVGLRNYYVGGTFALTTSQMGPNFYIGNHPGAAGGYETLRADRGDPRYESQDARLLAEADLKRQLSAGEVSRYWLNRSLTWIRSDPSGWLRLLAWKWFLTWNAVEMVDAESLRTHAEQSPLLKALGWLLDFGVICPLAVLGLWFTRRDWRRLWILYAMLIAFAAAVTLFYVFARYRYPLVPVAAMFAGAGLVGLWDHVSSRPRMPARELAIGLALATVAAIACNWRFAQVYSDDGITYYNAGSTLLDAGRYEDAIAMLEQAAAAAPNFGATYNNLGRAYQSLGDWPRARPYFEQAIRIEPKHAIYHFNLATVLLKEGDRQAAVEHLRQAVELDPLLIPAMAALARYELEQGDVAAGVAHLGRIVQLQPRAAATAHLEILRLATTRMPQAVAALDATLKRDRSLLGVANNLAWTLATSPDDTLRNGPLAVKLAESICRVTDNQSPEALDTLAAARAETGQFESAVAAIDQGLALCQDGRQAELAKLLQSHRASYAAGRPLREAAPQGQTNK